MRSRLADAQPLLYGVGADRDDDGGTPPGSGDEDAVATWHPTGEPTVGGDCVFWPRRQRPPLDKTGFYGVP